MNFADAAWFATWSQSHYDPVRRAVILAGDPPAYVVAHEEAHARQHQRRTFLYRMWRMALRAERCARLLLEADADRQARAELRKTGRWNAENERAARIVMETYGL